MTVNPVIFKIGLLAITPQAQNTAVWCFQTILHDLMFFYMLMYSFIARFEGTHVEIPLIWGGTVQRERKYFTELEIVTLEWYCIYGKRTGITYPTVVFVFCLLCKKLACRTANSRWWTLIILANCYIVWWLMFRCVSKVVNLEYRRVARLNFQVKEDNTVTFQLFFLAHINKWNVSILSSLTWKLRSASLAYFLF